ncbi:hypothetical protein D9613_007404 [Agrocybe pediades]|uniref:F-box domain-containing protein n=1 Tax=Agrocybe pediades TaxID=84607 RepID=A0A8H4QM15_9AGAR|nr:hypothetical protein D9613_007404 [Agrocybe pediades]
MASASEDMPKHPDLPQEIVDQIVDHVQGRRSRNASNKPLSTCALVSRSWRHSSQRYLYRRLVINGMYGENVRRLAELVGSPLEGITCHVRSVVINIMDREGNVTFFLDDRNVMKVLYAIFRGGEQRNDYSISLRLWKLPAIQLPPPFMIPWTHGKVDWRKIPQEFKDLLAETVNKGMLKHLQLSHLINIPKFFLELSTLESIGFNSMVFKFTRMPYPADGPSSQTIHDDGREMLFLKAFDIPESVQSSLDFSGVKALCCTLSYPGDWIDTFMMLRKCSSSLESLRIVVDPHSTPGPLIVKAVRDKSRNKRLELKNLKKLTIMNSGEAIRKDSTGASQQHNSTICIYEVLGVLQVLQLDKSWAADVQANQGGNNNEPILETLDIHIMFPDLRALSIRPELYASLSDILAYTPKFRYAKVVTVHFFRPPLASRADDLRTEGCFLGQAKAEAMRSRLEAVFPAVIQARANIGPFHIVLDVDPPETDIL